MNLESFYRSMTSLDNCERKVNASIELLRKQSGNSNGRDTTECLEAVGQKRRRLTRWLKTTFYRS